MDGKYIYIFRILLYIRYNIFLIEDYKNTLVPNSWPTEACAKHGGFVTWLRMSPLFLLLQICTIFKHQVCSCLSYSFCITYRKKYYLLPLRVLLLAYCILLYNWYGNHQPCEDNSRVICTFQYHYSFQINCLSTANGYTTAEDNASGLKTFFLLSYILLM